MASHLLTCPQPAHHGQHLDQLLEATYAHAKHIFDIAIYWHRRRDHGVKARIITDKEDAGRRVNWRITRNSSSQFRKTRLWSHVHESLDHRRLGRHVQLVQLIGVRKHAKRRDAPDPT